MDSCPKELEPYEKAHKSTIKENDYLQHLWWGNYGISAFTVAVDRVLHGKKAVAEYIKEPVLKQIYEFEELTEEEVYRRELEKAIIAEEQWISAGKQKGLPETII